MPSYADQMAASHEALRQRAVGPVRLTISRGRPHVDQQGEVWYGENWEQEDVMDADVEEFAPLTEQEHLLELNLRSSVSEGKARPSTSLANALTNLIPEGSVLLVLDTNTMLSCLNLLASLFDQLFADNLASLQGRHPRSAPLAILIPNVVVEELDHLKNSDRETTLRRSATSRQRISYSVGALARKANKWMLMALQTQKRTTYVAHSPQLTRKPIPEPAWAMHIESKSHALALVLHHQPRGDLSTLSPDQRIILLCRHLNQSIGSQACLCTSDANARLSAEAEAILTFDLDDLDLSGLSLSRKDDDEERRSWNILARELIDQWRDQMGFLTKCFNEEGDSTRSTQSDVEANEMTSDLTSTGLRMTTMAAAATPITAPTFPSSVAQQAQQQGSLLRTELCNAVEQCYTPVAPTKESAHRRISPDDYPDKTDRTTGSSFWATKRQYQ